METKMTKTTLRKKRFLSLTLTLKDKRKVIDFFTFCRQSITGNETELKLCDQYGEIVGSTNAKEFIALSTLIAEIKRYKTTEV